MNDLGLLYTASKKTESVIDLQFPQLIELKVKPRNYRKGARKNLAGSIRRRPTKGR